MALPSGFEDYLSYEFSSPATALSRAQSHRAALMGEIAARVASDGASYDPSNLTEIIKLVDKDIRRLASRSNRSYQPRLVPAVRVDPLGTYQGNQR